MMRSGSGESTQIPGELSDRHFAGAGSSALDQVAFEASILEPYAIPHNRCTPFTVTNLCFAEIL